MPDELKKALEAKQLELRDALDAYGTFLAGVPENKSERTEDQNTQIRTMLEHQESLDTELQTIEDKIKLRNLQEHYEERKARLAATDPNENDPKRALGDPVTVEIPDQPVYRGPWALGQQLRDIAATKDIAEFNTPYGREARSRLDQCERRRIEIARRMYATRAQTPTQQELVASDGGIFLQTETATELLDHGLSEGRIVSQADRRTLSGPNSKLEIIGIDETSRKDGFRYGGIRWYPVGELKDITASQTKFSKIALEPSKVGAAFHASEEVLQDVSFLAGEVTQLVGKELGFALDHYAYEGDGASDPMLGLMNCPCRIEVPKKSTQAAGSIVAENILAMKTRCMRYENAVWFGNQFIEDQLLQLYIPLGDSGELMKIYRPAMRNGEITTLWGRPYIPIEQAEVAGTPGDLVLADMTQYIVADKGGMQTASSIHVEFLAEQRTFRFTVRVDGQCRWKTEVEAYKGTTTVSPIVTIAVRA